MSALRALRTPSALTARCFSTSAARGQSFARMTVLGHVVQDIELVPTNSGLTVGKYSIAVNNRNKDGSEATSYFRVAAFEPSDYTKKLTKGTQVHVEADASMRKYETKEGAQAVALDLIQRRLSVLKRPRSEEE